MYLKFDFSFQKTKSKFQNVILPMDKATLLLWNEPKHNYVGTPVREMTAVPVGLRRTWFSAVGLLLGRKSKISHEKNVFIFQFYIRTPAKFQASRFNNKKRYLGRAYALKLK